MNFLTMDIFWTNLGHGKTLPDRSTCPLTARGLPGQSFDLDKLWTNLVFVNLPSDHLMLAWTQFGQSTCYMGQLCISHEKYRLLGSWCDLLREEGTICASFTQPAFRGFVRPCSSTWLFSSVDPAQWLIKQTYTTWIKLNMKWCSQIKPLLAATMPAANKEQFAWLLPPAKLQVGSIELLILEYSISGKVESWKISIEKNVR